MGISVLRNAYNEVSRCLSGGGCAAPLRSLDPSTVKAVLDTLAYCADPQRMDDVKCEQGLTRGDEAWKVAESLVNFDPYRYSAELNAMRHFIAYDGRECSVRQLDEAVLYHTDTHAGWASAEVVREFLERICRVRVSVKQVPGLGVFGRLFEGLSNLVREAYCDIERYKRGGSVVFLNLTGGFKPELGAFFLAGALAGASAAYYIHEASKEPVFIPVVRMRPAGDPELVGEIAEALVSRGKVSPSDMPGYAWILFIAEAMGVAERLEDGSFKLDKERARYLAGYIKRLASPGNC
jgi:putative CRISPR-associated protein (TIGR02619 family)